MKEQIEILKAFFAANPTADSIYCEFDGSGDNGQINEVIVHSDPEQPLLKPTLTSEVRSAAEEVAYAALEMQGIDWYNNDGGYGTCGITKDMEVNLETNERYIKTYEDVYVVTGDDLSVKE